MLGRFLEFSVGAPPTAATLADYAALGLVDTRAPEVPGGAYAVLSDGHVRVGLHDAEVEGPAPTFVRPDLKDHVRPLRRAGVEFESLDLAPEAFHRAAFRDPDGLLVLLVEARGAPMPPEAAGLVAVCGDLLELSVAAASLERAAAFWQRLGLAAEARGGSPHPYVRLAGHGLTLGLHETMRFRAALTFRARDLTARAAYLEAKGARLRRPAPVGGPDSAALRLPGGLEVFLIEAD